MTAVTFNACLTLAVLSVLTFSCWRKYRICLHTIVHKSSGVREREVDLMVDLLVVLFFPAVLAVLLSIAELRIKYAENNS